MFEFFRIVISQSKCWFCAATSLPKGEKFWKI